MLNSDSMRSGRLGITVVLVATSLAAGGAVRAADPTTAECLAANEKAVTAYRQHNLREARQELLVCAATTCPADVRVECSKRAVDVNAAIPTIVFEVRDSADNELTAVSVTMDGQPLFDRIEGIAVPLDPGEHKFTFRVEGRPTVEKTLVLYEGQKDRHERIVIAALTAPAAPPVTAPPPAPPPGFPPPPPPVESSSGGGSTLLPFVVGGFGLAGVVVGSIAGGLSLSAWSDAQSKCGSPSSCPDYSDAQSAHSRAQTDATISDVAFGVGAAGLVAAGVLWLFRPSASRTAALVSPMVGPGGSGLQVAGGF
jgi:hypothetical protein